MLQKIAGRLQTVVLVFIVSLISVVFILQFGGPQAEGCTTKQSLYVAEVQGETLTAGEVDAQRKLAGFDRFPDEVAKQLGLDKLVLEGLVERVLLSKEAMDLGLKASEEAVMRRIAETGMARVSLGAGAPFGIGRSERPLPIKDEKGSFDKEAFKRFVQFGLRRSIGGFLESQQQEQLAQYMRDMVKASVAVPAQHLRRAYERENDRRTASYVRFSPKYFEGKLVEGSPAQKAWVEAQKERIDKELKRLKKEDASTKREEVALSLWKEAAGKRQAKNQAKALLARLTSGEVSWEDASTELETIAKREAEEATTGAPGSDLSSAQASASEAEEATQVTDAEGTQEPEVNPLAPAANTTSAFRRIDAPITGAFDSAPFVSVAFSMKKVGRVHPKLVKLGEDYFLVRLDDITKVSDETFKAESGAFGEKMLDAERTFAQQMFVAKLRQRSGDKIKFAAASAP